MKKVLDFGSGKGYFTDYLSKKYDAYGVDIDRRNLNFAKKKFSRPKFIYSDGEKLLFKDSFFDKIYCLDVLEHVDNLKKTLVELKRVLKFGGIIEIEIPYWKSEKFLTKIRPTYPKEIHHVRVFKDGQLEKILEKNRFEIQSRSKEQFIKNIELWLILRKYPLKSQFGENDAPQSRVKTAFFFLFSKRLFMTPLKYFIPIWIFTLPPALIMDKIFPKSIKIIAQKK